MPFLLAIDDDPASLAAVRLALREMPIPVLFAASAENGLEIIRMERPVLIVTDHQLPGMTGLELLEEVRSRWPAVRGVLHTGDPLAQVLAAYLRFPVVVKGSHPTTLRTLVAGLLEPRVAPPASPSPAKRG